MLQAFPRRAAGVAVAIVQYVGLLSYPGGEALIRQRSWLKCRLLCPKALYLASLDHLEAQAAPTHPRAARPNLGSLPWSRSSPQAAPKLRTSVFNRASSSRRERPLGSQATLRDAASAA